MLEVQDSASDSSSASTYELPSEFCCHTWSGENYTGTMQKFCLARNFFGIMAPSTALSLVGSNARGDDDMESFICGDRVSV